MNNKDYISELAHRTGYTKTMTQRLVNDVVAAMSDSLLEGDAVSVAGFGTFEVKKKLERIMTNPNTGARMLVPPKLVVNFKISDAWKGKIRSGGAQ